jgi:polar amino acid transport system substrate-binding protein
MRWTRRQLLGLGALVVSGGTLSACADTVAGTPRAARTLPRRPTSSRAPAPRQIRVAILEGDTHYDEIARAVLNKIGVDRIQTTKVKFEQMIVALQAKRVDMAAGLYPNPQTCGGKLQWSTPDNLGLTALGVPPGNPKGLTTLADVQAKGATVSVMRDLPEHKYLTRIGLPANKLQSFPGPIEMLDAVTKGKADCTAFNDVGLRGMVKADLAKLDVTIGFALDGEPPLVGAYAFQSDGEFEDLVEKFNTELRRMHRSGDWLRISESQGFTKENVPPADLTVEKACAG